jgi:hypothetical protein
MNTALSPRVGLLFLLGALLPVSASDASPHSESRTTGSEIGRVRLQSSRISEGLSVDRAKVLWRGREQRVVDVQGGDTGPLELGLLVDGSIGASPFSSALLEGARSVVEGLLVPRDRLFVATFGSQAELLGSSRGDYRQLLDRLPDEPRAERAGLAAALPWALRQFQGEDARAALIVVFDGCQGRDQAMPGNLAETARERAIPIFLLYAARDCGRAKDDIDLTANEGSPAAGASTRALASLESAIGRTGGELFLLSDEKQLDPAFDAMVDAVRRQWLVVFEPESPAVRSSDVEALIAPGTP